MSPRERLVLSLSAAGFLLATLAAGLLLPSERETSVLVLCLLVPGYAIAGRVRFEFGGYYGTAEQLFIVPLALLAPLPYVLLLVALGTFVATLPDIAEGTWHRDRLLGCIADCWFAVPPVFVLAAFAPGPPELGLAAVYVLAFAAQAAGDLTWSLTRRGLLDRTPFRLHLQTWIGAVGVDAVLSPVAFMVTLAAARDPLALVAIGPLVWLFHSFSRDRVERYAAALELQRAYRGTVMLLSDVVEFEDRYTADHSRSVVDLAHAVADELGVPRDGRQELEFAALLHDVGKIAIPKEILNKPASLTREEFELVKTHTIEAQFMLDRVGGLLARVGEIVRSCHERWDGTGYPDGIAGDDIPLASRIVFACDAYNAMTTDRVYRAAMSDEEALHELAAGAGSQFDPHVVRALVRVVTEREPVLPPVDAVRAVLADPAVAQGLRAAT